MTRIGIFISLRQLGLLAVLFGLSAVASAASPDDTRAKIVTTSQQSLGRLYAAQPSAKSAIAGSKGYATFSKWGITLGVIGGGIGSGLAVAKPSGKKTYMRYVEGSAGFGLGVKKYDLIFVFMSDQALSDFVNKGWEYNAQATAAAKSTSAGKAFDGAISISPGIWLYQVTSAGLVAEIGIKGTKYYKDTTLN